METPEEKLIPSDLPAKQATKEAVQQFETTADIIASMLFKACNVSDPNHIRKMQDHKTLHDLMDEVGLLMNLATRQGPGL